MTAGKRLVSLLVLLVSSPLWGACAGVSQGRPPQPGYQDAIAQSLVTKYSQPNAIPGDMSKVSVQERNQILNDLIFLTDVNYYNFQSELYQGRALFDTTTDLAIIGLGAAGALIGSSVTQAILAAISAGIAGGRVSINKNYFHEASTQALIAKMDSSRKTKLDLIRKALTLDTTDYPLAQGLGDVAEYYNAGTIIGALQNIVADAGFETRTADASLAKTINAKYLKDATGDVLRKFWKPDGTNIDLANEAAIKDWMKKHDLEKVSITLFLRGDIYKEDRAKAVEELKLGK